MPGPNADGPLNARALGLHSRPPRKGAPGAKQTRPATGWAELKSARVVRLTPFLHPSRSAEPKLLHERSGRSAPLWPPFEHSARRHRRHRPQPPRIYVAVRRCPSFDGFRPSPGWRRSAEAGLRPSANGRPCRALSPDSPCSKAEASHRTASTAPWIRQRRRIRHSRRSGRTARFPRTHPRRFL